MKLKTFLIFAPLVLIISALSAYIAITLPKIYSKNNQTQSIADIPVSAPGIQEFSYTDFSTINKCFGVLQDQKQKCLDDYIDKYAQVNSSTTPQLLALVESLRATNPTIEANCHPITHSIGRYTFTKYKNVGDAFGVCDLTCNSGCYHGVMERMFFSDAELADTTKHLTSSDLASKVVGVCDPANFKNSASNVIYQCLHGLGHAILYSLDYKLVEGYKVCDNLKEGFDRSSCYGGVAMENVTAFDKTKRDLKRDDPLYPCDKLSSNYAPSCYEMQTSVMLEYGYTWKQMADLCKTAGAYANNCFLSLGRDLSNQIISGHLDDAVNGCEVYPGDPSYTQSCITNAVKSSVDRETKFGYTYCNALKEQADQSFCFQTVNSYSAFAYGLSADTVKNNCSQYSPSYKDLCISQID